MQNELNIVAIQANLIWENAEKNRSYFEDEINKLPEKTSLVILPEMFTSGFTLQPKNVAEKMNGITVAWVQKLATKKQLAICGSLVIEEHDKFYNRFVFIAPNSAPIIYDKRHSFSLATEDKYYTAGKTKQIINYKGFKICPLICYDLRFPVWSRNTENYDVLIYVANWPAVRIDAWQTLLKARAIENMSYVIGVNRVGQDGNQHNYSGQSQVLDPLGLEVASLKEEVGFLEATLSKENLLNCRAKFKFLEDRDQFKIVD
ncbi:amidohydrolase [uncultured Polaribacter sp.]|uniref:amidohydrolase n=1 Tax=uncultured Polaribacter sp. TaxID=174711 RepID=UPI002603839C|nr:amidohydrolase [uncultured Polaribacter sp.]